jgi:glycosyltransferase involved in cell wall biosynthesis
MSRDFSVAIVHYHLRGGGVTQVIRSASRALAGRGIRHVILSGEAPTGADDLPVKVIPGLAYRTEPGGPAAAEVLAEMKAAAGPEPVVWHFHNHSLGRNRVTAEAAALLATAGEAMVLQVHDLAEDGRPMNYPLVSGTRWLYPHSPRIRLAFLNARDHRHFLAAGLPAERSLVLPNPVDPPAVKALRSAQSPPLVLYPVRGIRRKNLGELLLLAALSPAGTRFAITRAPGVRRWTANYDAWRTFAVENGLPVEFAVVDRIAPAPGAPMTYESWLAHATHGVTTSVAEGFGFAFLEPAALGLPLIGRDLPEITAGLPVPAALYPRLDVPLAWAGDLERRIAAELGRLRKAYGRGTSPEHMGKVKAAMIRDGRVDFGNLPEELQQGILRRILAGDECDEIRTIRGNFAASLAGGPAPSADLGDYSPALYGERLERLYLEVVSADRGVVEEVSRERVVDRYLESFHFLLT